MDISRVVVDTDGYEGSVSEELEPIAEQLSRDEVAEPGGQLLVLSDHRGDVGQTCRGDVRLWYCDSVTPTCDQSDAEYWWGESDNDVSEGAV